MPQPLVLTSTLASPIVPVTGQPRLVYLLLEVGGGEGAHALPVNLGLVIDSSDSMRIRLVTDAQFSELARRGQAKEVMTDGVPAFQITSIPNELVSKFPRRIDYVSEALVIAGEYLRSADRFSLTAFAGRALTLIPATSGDERLRLQQAARDLEHLNLGDETRMSEGLALGFAEVQRNHVQAYASRLILLTDGHTRDVNECYAWARRAREVGFAVTTMGIGNEFNEDLLIPLADLTGGNAYYIETPDQIPAAFRKELGVALRISYKNVEIKLQMTSGVELRRVHRVLPELGAFDPGPNMKGSYALLLGNYDPAAPSGLLLEFVLPPWQAGSYRLAQALLAWDDPDGGQARPSQRQDIVVQLAQGASIPYNGRVMNIVEKVGAFKLGLQALEDAERGDRSVATARLRQAATRLLDMGESNLANSMIQQAQTLEKGGQVDPNATKKIRYETRRLTQNLD
jgi:Ca-activated chloride channel family protein